MLCFARSVRVESEAGEVIGRLKGAADVDGERAKTKRRLGAGAIRYSADFAQDKFLQKTVKIYLE